MFLFNRSSTFIILEAYLGAWCLLEKGVSLRGAFTEKITKKGAFVRSITVYSTLFIIFRLFEYFAYFVLFNYKGGYSETIFAFWHFTSMSQLHLCSYYNGITNIIQKVIIIAIRNGNNKDNSNDEHNKWKE